MTYWQDKRDGQVFVQQGDRLVCYTPCVRGEYAGDFPTGKEITQSSGATQQMCEQYCRKITKQAADQERMIIRLEGEGTYE